MNSSESTVVAKARHTYLKPFRSAFFEVDNRSLSAFDKLALLFGYSISPIFLSMICILAAWFIWLLEGSRPMLHILTATLPVTIFFGLGTMIYLFKALRRISHIRLLEEGVLTDGHIVGKPKDIVDHESKIVLARDYQIAFETTEGDKITFFQETKLMAAVEDEPYEAVLYMKDNPYNAVLADGLIEGLLFDEETSRIRFMNTRSHIGACMNIISILGYIGFLIYISL